MLVRLCALLFATGALAASATAQPCGLLTFGFATTGTGCAPVAGSPPSLAGALVPSPAITLCNVRFTLTPMGPFPIPGPPPGILGFGVSDPMLDLGPLGLPGCVLQTSVDVIVPLGPSPTSPSAQVATVPVPMSPSLLGASVYAQALLLLPVGGGIAPQMSNGLRVDIT